MLDTHTQHLGTHAPDTHTQTFADTHQVARNACQPPIELEAHTPHKHKAHIHTHTHGHTHCPHTHTHRKTDTSTTSLPRTWPRSHVCICIQPLSVCICTSTAQQNTLGSTAPAYPACSKHWKVCSGCSVFFDTKNGGSTKTCVCLSMWPGTVWGGGWVLLNCV